MRRWGRPLLVVFAVAALLVVAPSAKADPPTHETGYIPMSDGELLHYKVMLPDAAKFGSGPYPAVIDYSGYQPAINVYDGLDDRFIELGYAVVGVNIRGSSCSSGKFDYFEPRQSLDGVEAIDWLADRDWSNGEFAMVGKSYPGITQLFVAGAHSDDPADQARIDAILADHLKAIVPGHVFADLYRDVPFPGGISNITFAAGWSTQRYEESFAVGPQYAQETGDQQCLANQADHAVNPIFNPFTRSIPNQYDGPLFYERSPWYFAEHIETPMMLVEAWQDEQVGSRATHLLERVRDDLPWRFIATNGDHGEYYGEEAFPHIVEFLAHYLPPTGAKAKNPAEIRKYEAADRVLVNWENGADGDRRSAFSTTYATWPPPEQTVHRMFLGADGSLGAPAPPAGEVSYLYTPAIGSQARGGYDLAGEPQLQDWTYRAPDGTTASFTSEPLATDMLLLGSASVDLWLSSTAPDTDLEVTLSEVRPDGQEVFIQQGWLRASHRTEVPELSTELRPYQSHLLTDSVPLVPGQPSLLRVEVFPFGHALRAGSQLRITIAAPHVAPDLWGFAELPLPARNTIHTTQVHPSSIALPVLAGATAPTPFPPCTLRNQPCREATP